MLMWSSNAVGINLNNITSERLINLILYFFLVNRNNEQYSFLKSYNDASKRFDPVLTSHRSR